MCSISKCCRLCLQKFSGPSQPMQDLNILNMVIHLFPGMHINLVQLPEICQECFKYVQFSHSIKNTIVTNEQKIMLNRSSIQAVEKNMCILCLKTEDLGANIFLYEHQEQTMPFSEARSIVGIASLDWDFDIFRKPVICNSCWQIVRSIFLFKKRCFATEKILKFYALQQQLETLTKENLESISDCYNANVQKFSGVNSNIIIKNDLEVALELPSSSFANIVKPVDVYLNNFPNDKEELEIEDIESLKQESFVFLTLNVPNTYQNEAELCSNVSDISLEEYGESLNNTDLLFNTKDTNKASLNLSSNSEESLDKEGSNTTKTKRKMKGRKKELVDYHFCDTCDYFSKYKHLVKRHMLTHNAKSGLLSCNLCIYTTKIKRNLTRHMLSHGIEELFKCPHCPYTSCHKEHLREHILTHDRKHEEDLFAVFKCEKCPYSSSRDEQMKHHLRTHLSNNVHVHKCLECPYITTRKYSLKIHMQIHSKLQESKKFKCDKCSFRAKRRTEIKSHEVIHENSFKFLCSKCPYKAKRKSHLVTHMLLHQGSKMVLRCPYCKYKSGRKDHLKSHCRNQHAKEGDPYFKEVPVLKKTKDEKHND